MRESSNEGAKDGVRLALLNNRLQGMARKMANTLLRTGRSGVLGRMSKAGSSNAGGAGGGGATSLRADPRALSILLSPLMFRAS